MEWKYTLANMIVPLLIISAIVFKVTCGDCPTDAVQRMTQCTSTIRQVHNLTYGKSSLQDLQKTCRILQKIPICLKKILFECKGHTDIAPTMNNLKAETYKWKTKFDKLCEFLCGDITTDTGASFQQTAQGSLITITLTMSILMPCLL